MTSRTKVKSTYQVTYTVTVPEDVVEAARAQGKDIEDCAWHVMETTHVKPTITKVEGSLPWAVLGSYITHPDQERGPAHFEDLPSDKFTELFHKGCFDPDQVFGNYHTLAELVQFLIDVPEFCVGGLFYKDERIVLTEITCNVMISDAKMIRYLKFARKADEFDTDNGALRAWWD